MELTYKVKDKPKFGAMLVFALQQLLAILAATIAVPTIVGNGMDTAAALFGAGVGTLVYLLFTGFRSPVFLGSSFAFIGSMCAAFAGAGSVVALGYLGLVIGRARVRRDSAHRQARGGQVDLQAHARSCYRPDGLHHRPFACRQRDRRCLQG